MDINFKNDIIDELYRLFLGTNRIPETKRVEEEYENMSDLLEDLLVFLPKKDVDAIEDIINNFGHSFENMGFRAGFEIAKEILK